MRVARATSLLVSSFLSASHAGAQTAAPLEVVGHLVGPGSTPTQPALRLYGNDLGWTFEHDGRLVMLFGDTWPDAMSLCEGEPANDDTVATLPLEPPSGLPPLTFVTRPEDPNEFAPITVARGGESLSMAYGQVPIAGFSDGTNAFAVMGRGDYVRCVRRSPRKDPSCERKTGFACTQAVGECTPQLLAIPTLCNLETGTGCLPGTTCEPSPTGFCIDPTSSQNDGATSSLPSMIAHDQEIAVHDCRNALSRDEPKIAWRARG